MYYDFLRCYLACFCCSSGQYVEYYKCGDSSCGCNIHNNFPSDRTSLDCVTQPQACYKCPPGYFHDCSLGSFCYKCSHPDCKCTEANNCPECVAGKYNVTNSCQDTCSGNCMNCTDATICGDCASVNYGISCESDYINTCNGGSCDKILGKCLECPFGKYPDSSNNFGVTFCRVSLKRWIFCWIQQRADQQNCPKTLNCWIADTFNLYRYIAHFYCLALQAGSFSDVVVFTSHAESRGFDPQPCQVRRYVPSPVTFGAQRK